MADLSLMGKYNNDPYARFRANRNDLFIKDIINTPRTDGTPRQVALPPKLPPAQNVPFADKAQQVAAQVPGLIAPQANTNVPGPASVGEEAINKGAQAGLLSNLVDGLGNINFKNIAENAIYGAANPTMGGNFITEQATGQIMRDAGNLEAAKEQAKLEVERLKNAPKPPKPSSEITKLYKSLESGKQSLKTINQMKKIISNSSTVSGGPGVVAETFQGLLGLFGGSLDIPTDKTKFIQKRANLALNVFASGVFGREVSKTEIEKILEKILPEPGITATKSELLSSLDQFAKKTSRDMQSATNLITKVYGLPNPEVTLSSESKSFERMNNGN